jgi:hypothetical protein
MDRRQVEQDIFLGTYSGRELLKKHNMDETGIWEVRGEDPNCDMGGSHHQPYLGTYEGTLRDVAEAAVEMSGFWQWGGGGSIKKLKIQKPTRIAEAEKLAILGKLNQRERVLLDLEDEYQVLIANSD